MVGTLQPLGSNFKITNPDGTPTDYFIQWAQQRQIDIGQGITAADAQALIDSWAGARDIIAGNGLDGGGNLSGDVTIDANASAILDLISSTRGTVLYRGASAWSGLAPGTSGHFLKTNGSGADPAWAAAGGGGSPTLPTIRGSGIQSSSASSYTVNFPSGTVAGDRAVVFAGHGFGVNLPSGWVSLSALTGTNWNGAAFTRVLSASDITTGSVTVTTAGSFNGVLAIVTFVGATSGIRLPVADSRNGSGAATRVLSTDGSPLTTDMILYFGSNRNNSTDTVDLGTALQTISATSASGVLKGAAPAATGGVTATFSYSVTSGTTGDYQIIVVVSGGN